MSDQKKWKGQLTDTNRWYRDSKNALYNTERAIEHRIKMDKQAAQAAATRSRNRQFKLQIESILGEERAGEVVDRVRCLVSDYDYGLDVPTHVNWRGKGWPDRLTKAQVYQHLAGHCKIYYTAHPYQLGLMKLVMVTVDIDNPKHVSNSETSAALRAAKRICKDLKKLGASVMMQPSTNGNGYHVTFCISFPLNALNTAIREQLASLRTDIASKYKCYRCHEICLKGVNYAVKDSKPDVYGTLVKLPSISNLEQSGEFLAMTNAPVSFASLADFYSLTQDKVRNSSHSSQTKNADSISSTSHPGLLVEEAGSDTKLTSCGDKSPLVTSRTRSGDHEWNENDPLGRMYKAASLYCHKYQRPPSAEELMAYYELLNYHTGRAKPDRLHRAKKAVEWVETNHNFILPSEQTLYRKWEKCFRYMGYTKEQLVYYGNRAIRSEHLALVASLIERKELEGHTGGITMGFFIKVSQQKKSRGEIGFTLDGKMMRFCIEFLMQNKFIEIVKPYGLGVGGVYRVIGS